MKRVFLMILTLLLLTACGKKEQNGVPSMDRPSAEQTEEIRVIGLYRLSCEWEEYDPSVERISFRVENRSGADVETGTDCALEMLDETGVWRPIPVAENVGWNAMALMIPSGGCITLTCTLSAFDHDFSDGVYRIVKDMAGTVCAGEFRLRTGAAVSKEAPYGFAPLEALPEGFGAAELSGNEVAFTEDGATGLDAVETFLEKSGLGADCQLRTVQDYGEGTPMVIDVICENDHFLWRMWSQGTVTEQRFSYIVTDGRDLYLSNGVDWEQTQRYDSATAFLIPQGVTGAMLTAAERQAAARLDGSVIRYRVWSADGVWNAALTTEPTEFAVEWQKAGEGSRGELFDIRSWDGPETAVTALEWQENGDLRLTCNTAAGGVSHPVFEGTSRTLRSGDR